MGSEPSDTQDFKNGNYPVHSKGLCASPSLSFSFFKQEVDLNNKLLDLKRKLSRIHLF